MSSSITLSAATRQNLLSLQDTASLLSTTQTRLSTGKKVNSALDNPTNFFTSQKLTARSGDLSSLLDGISGGIQAIQAANQGITSMQKLLDTAKSTAQQALADKTGGAGGVLGGSAAQAAKVTGTATLSSLGTTGANGPTFDLSSPAKDASLDISLDGGATRTTIRLDKTALSASVSDLSHVTADQLVSAINGQIAGSAALAGKLTAGTSADGRVTFTTTATGAGAQVSVAGSANSTLDIGFGKSTTAPTQAIVTASAALGTNTDFGNGAGATLTVSDGTKSVVVSLDKDSAIDALGGKLAPDVTANGTTRNLASQANVLAAIKKQLGDAGSSVVASLGQGADAGKIVFTSADVGPDAQVSVVAGADTTQNVGGGATGLGFTTFTPGGTNPTVSALALGAPPSATLATQSSTPGAAAGANNTPPASNGKTTFSAQTLSANLAVSATQSTTFSVNGTTVTLNAQSPVDNAGNTLGSGTVAPARVVQAINKQLTAAGVTAQATLNNGALVFTDTRTAGTGSTAPTVVTAGTGMTDQLGLFGTPATTKLGAALPTSIDLSTGQGATFTIGGNGTTTTVTLGSTSATDNSGGTLGNNPNKSQLAAAINQQLAAGTTGVTAYIDGTNNLAFTGRDDATTLPTLAGVSDTIGLGFGTAAATTEQGTTTRTPAGTVDLSGGKSSSFSITAGPSGSPQTKTVTINAQSLDKSGTALGASASEAKIAEAIQVQLDSTANGATAVAAKVAFTPGHSLTVTSNAIGTGASASLTALSDTAGLGLGTTAQTSGKTTPGTGTAAAAVTASGAAATDGSSTATISGSIILSPTTAVAANGNASFNLTLGSGPTKTINVQGGTAGLSAAALVKSINDQIGADTGLAGNVSASLVNGRLSIATTASGSTQKLTIQSGGAADIGLGTTTASSGALTGTGSDVGGSKGTSSVRQTLAQQYNNLLGQISQQARDANYNGVNLLYRTSNNASDNTLHITFNENNTSALDITGVKFDADGLGLTAVTGGFQSDADITAVISKLNDATTTLRTQSSTFGSNLTVVQNRQDFTKALTNILDTGAANLTNADLNEEAANSQALSTRNSLAISALSLANQAQQGILQLLR